MDRVSANALSGQWGADHLADFLVRAQLAMADPHLDGAWTGSLNVAKGFPGGDMDDEGNLYDLYTSWGAAPIVYGLTTLATRCKP